MAKKDENLIEMEKIYEEQQREYAEEKKNNEENSQKKKKSVDQMVAFGIRIVRMILIIVIMFFVVKYEFKLLGNFEDAINTGVNENSNNGKKEDKNIMVEAIRLTGPTDPIKVGHMAHINVEILPSDATNRDLQFVSSDPSVVHVDNVGNIKGESKGTATIIVLAKNNIQSSITITVIE